MLNSDFDTINKIMIANEVVYNLDNLLLELLPEILAKYVNNLTSFLKGNDLIRKFMLFLINTNKDLILKKMLEILYIDNDEEYMGDCADIYRDYEGKNICIKLDSLFFGYFTYETNGINVEKQIQEVINNITHQQLGTYLKSVHEKWFPIIPFDMMIVCNALKFINLVLDVAINIGNFKMIYEMESKIQHYDYGYEDGFSKTEEYKQFNEYLETAMVKCEEYYESNDEYKKYVDYVNEIEDWA